MKNWRGGSAGRSYFFFTSAWNFSSNLLSSSSMSKAILFHSHHVFHTLNQNDVLLLVLVFFAPFRRYCIVSGQSKPFLIECSHFFSLEKTCFKVLKKHFVIILRDTIGLENVLLSFNQS